MIAGYAYSAMLVTGIMHGLVGFSTFVISIMGLNNSESIGSLYRIFNGVAFFTSLWVLMIGILGILAGVRKLADPAILKLKIAYMVTAILSACIFSFVGISMFFLSFPLAGNVKHYYAAIVGGCAMCLEFILAVVSSSICCCCSGLTPTTTVVIQQPGPAAQYQTYPTGVVITNQ